MARRYSLVIYIILSAFMLTSCNKSPQKELGSPKEISEDTPTAKTATQIILFFGNSLTAGFGVDEELAFPSLIQERLDSLGWPFRVLNAGLSGETTSSGTNRIEWVLREPVAILVLELGGNDGLRGIDPEVVKDNLQEIVDLARAKYPEIKIIVAGMEAPPNMGQQYIQKFRQVFPQIARDNNLPLIPFLLEGVGGENHLNLPDGIHPNEEGHKLVAENVWTVLEPLLTATKADAGDN